jgi:regulator of sigma E protease
VVPASAAAAAGFEAGDRILAVDGEPAETLADIYEALYAPAAAPADSLGERSITFEVRRSDRTLELVMRRPADPIATDWQSGLRLGDTELGLVKKGGPADRLGLRRGDRVVAVAGEPVRSFEGLAEIVRRHGGDAITVTWERDGRRMEGTVVPDVVAVGPDSTIGQLAIERYFDHRKVGPIEAFGIGATSLWRTVEMIVRGLVKLVSGALGMEAIGGPIRIAQTAGEMLRWSFDYLVAFIAFFSVNLFLLNLLPIPVLDGGHVVFLLYELIRGKPAPERLQAIATQMGLILLLLFMTFVVVLELWTVTGH